MSTTEDLTQDSRIQPSLGSSAAGSRTCSAADVERMFSEMVHKSQQSAEPFCLIASAPFGGEALLRTRLLQEPLLQKSIGRAANVACPELLGSSCPSEDLAAAIYEHLTSAPAPNSEQKIWRRVRAEISRRGVSLLMVGQFDKAIFGQSAKSRRQIFQNIDGLMRYRCGALPISLVLTGGPQLTKALSKEVELLHRVIVMPIDTDAIAEVAPQR